MFGVKHLAYIVDLFNELSMKKIQIMMNLVIDISSMNVVDLTCTSLYIFKCIFLKFMIRIIDIFNIQRNHVSNII